MSSELVNVELHFPDTSHNVKLPPALLPRKGDAFMWDGGDGTIEEIPWEVTRITWSWASGSPDRMVFDGVLITLDPLPASKYDPYLTELVAKEEGDIE